jgi:hypothetical protein
MKAKSDDTDVPIGHLKHHLAPPHTEAWHTLSLAVLTTIMLQLAAVYVPLLQSPLHTVALNPTQWGVILVCAMIPVVLVEGVKLAQRWANRAKRY